MSVAADRQYSKTHEWAKKEGDLLVIGISDFAQHELGDIVFVELPPVGSKFKKGETFGVIESVKAASDVYLPVAGEVVETNDGLVNDPALLNKDAHGAAWLLKIKAGNPADVETLMDAAAYEKFIASDEAKH
jgi:glycine cleavage system H protein